MLPVAYNDTFSIDEDVTTTLNVLYNDRDEELLTNPGAEEIFINSVTDNDPNAEITASADNKSVQIVPLADYNGPVTLPIRFTIWRTQSVMSQPLR
jgi:hypothetical protein